MSFHYEVTIVLRVWTAFFPLFTVLSRHSPQIIRAVVASMWNYRDNSELQSHGVGVLAVFADVKPLTQTIAKYAGAGATCVALSAYPDDQEVCVRVCVFPSACVTHDVCGMRVPGCVMTSNVGTCKISVACETFLVCPSCCMPVCASVCCVMDCD